MLGTFMDTTTSFPTLAAVIQEGVVATRLTATAFGALKLSVVSPLPSHRNGFSSVTDGVLALVNTPVVTGLISMVPDTAKPPLQPGPAVVKVYM